MVTQAYICTNDDLELEPDLSVKEEKDGLPVHYFMGIRTAVMSAYEVPRMFFHSRHFGKGLNAQLGSAFVMMVYGQIAPGHGRKKIAMKVDELVVKWSDAVIGLTVAHDKDEMDNWESQVDGLLKPLLDAPVKQLREFYQKLLKTLKSNKQCPFIVWRSLEAWGEVMIKDAPDEGVRKLKKKLASEIVDLCEQDVLPQFPEAMVRALQWRDPQQLEEIKGQLEKGVKPKVRGRESCLFLEVGSGKNKAVVQL